MAKVTWLTPQPLQGSGGIRNIFTYIALLQDEGHDVRVAIDPSYSGTPEQAATEIRKYYDVHIHTPVQIGYEPTEPTDVVIATAWFTAPFARDHPNAAHRIYFIQDYEAFFQPMGDYYLMAHNTYQYGLAPITSTKWLSNFLQYTFSTPSRHFDLTVDHQIYRPEQNATPERPQIAFLYQPEKPRRCVNLGLDALSIVYKIRPDLEIHTYGSPQPPNGQFPYRHHGLISPLQCNALYNNSTLGLCLSATNPSRIPIEMMASGLPVVDLYLPNNLIDFPDSSVLLCEPTPEAIASGIVHLLNSPSSTARMRDTGITFTQALPDSLAATQFISALNELLSSPISQFSSRPMSPLLYRQEPFKSFFRSSSTYFFTPRPHRFNIVTPITQNHKYNLLKRHFARMFPKLSRRLRPLYHRLTK